VDNQCRAEVVYGAARSCGKATPSALASRSSTLRSDTCPALNVGNDRPAQLDSFANCS
jgi:hypothetical protein